MLLATTGLSRSFGALKAVDDVELTVRAGSRHALIGPNGAGKSTLFKLVTGLLRPSAGRVVFQGEDITTQSEVKRARLGLAQTLQQVSLFPSLTVAENVTLAVRRHHGGAILPVPAGRRRRGELAARVAGLLERTGLSGRGGVSTAALSHGESKHLELALALACDPRLLLLDEPAAGMSAAESATLAELIKGLPDDITVLFIEHDLDLVFRLATDVTVLHLGQVLLSGSPDDIRDDERVQEAYLGTSRREDLFTPESTGESGVTSRP